MPTGNEMLIQSVLKMLGIKPEMIEQTFADLKRLGDYGKAVDANMAVIATNQVLILEQNKLILELLSKQSGDADEIIPLPAIPLHTPEDQTGEIHHAE